MVMWERAAGPAGGNGGCAGRRPEPKGYIWARGLRPWVRFLYVEGGMGYPEDKVFMPRSHTSFRIMSRNSS